MLLLVRAVKKAASCDTCLLCSMLLKMIKQGYSFFIISTKGVHSPNKRKDIPTCKQTFIVLYKEHSSGGSRISGRGGGGGLITIFTSGGGYWRGRVPPVTARGSEGAL